jgi:ATP-dependent Zn protease
MGNVVPLLHELPLTEPVRHWSSQLLADLGAVKSGAMPPDGLVYAMLEGPPGTGKSLIAESLARTAGWTFVPVTVGSWFASGDGALGGVAKNVRAFIDKVIVSEPAVGFLDEVDAIPDRATMDNRGKDWWTPVITLLLTEIDRLRRSGMRVMLIGATNYYHHLDSALVRPGRMQQRVSVLPPQSETEVAALFAYYLRGDLVETDLGKLARLGIGATPALVEGWLKEARGLARSAGRPLQLEDILGQMLPSEVRTPEDVWTIALHEIGHAVVACHLGLTVERVSIVPEGESGGHTRATLPSMVPTWERLCDMVTVSLGGRAADIIIGSGANAGAESDLANATAILLSAFERQGLRDGLAFMPALGVKRSDVVAAVEVQLARLMKRAIAIVEADRVVAVKLAKRLVAERILSGADVKSALATARPSRKQHSARATSTSSAARTTT